MSADFNRYILALEPAQFELLSGAVCFEDLTPGRKGNHLVELSARGVPLVRSTTPYHIPAHRLAPAHQQLITAIERAAGALNAPLAFNHALIEIYDRAYYKMGYHCDQALDLEEGSWIALYSCYEQPTSLASRRTLMVKDKQTAQERAILLEHNCVVIFSLEANGRYAHKIILDPPPAQAPATPENRWLGITLRQSKTYLNFDQGQPSFTDGTPLQLADEEQRKVFYKLRGQENKSLRFSYPKLDFTISPADLLMPR